MCVPRMQARKNSQGQGQWLSTEEDQSSLELWLSTREDKRKLGETLYTQILNW